MGFSPIQLQLPKLPTTNLSSLGNVAKSLPKPEALQVGKGFSTKDTFEAAPQRAAAKPQAEAAKAQVGTAQIGNAQNAQIGNSAKGGNNSQVGTANAQIGNADGNAQIGNAGGPAEAGGAGGAAGGDLASQLQAIVQKLQELIGQLTQLLQGGGAGAAGGGGEAAKAVGGGGGAGGAGGAGGGEMAAAGVQADDPRLQDALQRIGQDPEGAKLVQAAEAQGLKVQVGNLPPGVMGEHQDGVITISPNALKSDSDLIHTMAHELGHAATRGDGDSIAEEKAVDELGQRIQQRVAPGNTYQLDVGAYKGLSQDNGVRNSLAQIGIN